MEYEIIRLYPSGDFYEKASEAPDILIGQSRIGGPIIDLPENFHHPDNLYFMGMLDLNWLSQYDKQKLLPSSGYLLFFITRVMVGKGVCQFLGFPILEMHPVGMR